MPEKQLTFPWFYWLLAVAWLPIMVLLLLLVLSIEVIRYCLVRISHANQ